MSKLSPRSNMYAHHRFMESRGKPEPKVTGRMTLLQACRVYYSSECEEHGPYRGWVCPDCSTTRKT